MCLAKGIYQCHLSKNRTDLKTETDKYAKYDTIQVIDKPSFDFPFFFFH